MTSKATCIARTNRAFVRAVAGFAAFFAYRGFLSRAVISVVALRLEHAIAIAALVLRARKAQSAFVGRAAAFAASLPSGQLLQLWPCGSSVPPHLVHLWSEHAKLKALLWVVLPQSSHLLHTRNLPSCSFCLCPCSLYGAQYLVHTLWPVWCNSESQ